MPVNTLTRCTDGAIEGDNTDGIGLVSDMMIANLGWAVQGQRVLLLGAAAPPAVCWSRCCAKTAKLLIVNRTAERARQLATEFIDIGRARRGMH